jgi:selenide,water dikinase
VLRARDLPLLPGALAVAERGMWSGGMKRNRAYLDEALAARGQLVLAPGLGDALTGLLFEAETSGGLLFAAAPERAGDVHAGFARRGEPCWEVGEVTAAPGIAVA